MSGLTSHSARRTGPRPSRFTPAVTAYWQRLQERQAFKRALDAQKNAALKQRISIVPAPQTAPD